MLDGQFHDTINPIRVDTIIIYGHYLHINDNDTTIRSKLCSFPFSEIR